jgi:hypothetical protein
MSCLLPTLEVSMPSRLGLIGSMALFLAGLTCLALFPKRSDAG